MHPCYWSCSGYTNAPSCNITERPSLQGVPVHYTRVHTPVHDRDRGFRPSFPGRFYSCRSAAAVHLKGTSEKGCSAARKFSARGSMLASARTCIK
ncbi:hypothetical protein CSKR_109818 [Clonorchis sinensis]|uniref:Uncharacterized protein n=1 Tax=Clonorchis sinensis TaxID=79923 RepID=A0A3R7FQR3_CLOSI|nr:hypothetical protein CSKR_109818 [Clonorchis sinensis]